MTTIKCPHCGRDHALYWYVQAKSRKVHYTCDRKPQQSEHRLDGRPEVHHITDRIELHHDDLARIPTDKLNALPVVESAGYCKAITDEAQCKLPL